jgi:hypothetical protein
MDGFNFQLGSVPRLGVGNSGAYLIPLLWVGVYWTNSSPMKRNLLLRAHTRGREASAGLVRIQGRVPMQRSAFGVALCVVCVSLGPRELHAAERPTPSGGPSGIGTRGLPELFELQVPAQTSARFAAALSARVGYIEAVGDVHGVARLGGRMAFAYSPISKLTFSADFSGRVDTFPESADTMNGVGEPRVTGQAQLFESGEWQLGAAVQVRLVGAGAPSISWESTSPAFSALVARRFGSKTKLVFNVGFELDRSAHSVSSFEQLSDADRVTLGISQVPTLPMGLGLATLIGRSQHELLIEIFGRPGVGQGAPPLFVSPWTLRAGIRPHISPMLTGLLAFEVGISQRGAESEATSLAPIEPRLGALFGLVWGALPERPEHPSRAPAPPAAIAPPASPVVVKPVEPVFATLEGRAIGEAGQGVANAEVRVSAAGKWLATTATDAAGNFKFTNVPVASSYEVTVEAADFDLATVVVSEGERGEVVLYHALPQGAIEGRVTDYAGAPVAAEVRIEPGGLREMADADGRFQIDLAPGKYTLIFLANGFRSEVRVVQVEDKGVFIQNLALRR